MEAHYFVFGATLSRAIRSKCRAASGVRFPELRGGKVGAIVGATLIYSAPSTFWEGKVPVLLAAAKSDLYGVLYVLTADEMKHVDACERALGGVPLVVTIRCNGSTVSATTYAAQVSENLNDDIAVSEKYVAAMAQGARECNLPAGYVEALEAESMLLDRIQRFGRENNLLGEL